MLEAVAEVIRYHAMVHQNPVPLVAECSKSANIEESSSLNSSSATVDADVVISLEGVILRRESKDSRASSDVNASIANGVWCVANEGASKIAKKRKRGRKGRWGK